MIILKLLALIVWLVLCVGLVLMSFLVTSQIGASANELMNRLSPLLMGEVAGIGIAYGVLLALRFSNW
jgi:hypothetical protein